MLCRRIAQAQAIGSEVKLSQSSLLSSTSCYLLEGQPKEWTLRISHSIRRKPEHSRRVGIVAYFILSGYCSDPSQAAAQSLLRDYKANPTLALAAPGHWRSCPCRLN